MSHNVVKKKKCRKGVSVYTSVRMERGPQSEKEKKITKANRELLV